MSVIYGIVLVLDPVSACAAWDRSATLFLKVLPVLGIVLLVLLLSNLLLKPNRMRENLGQRSGPRGWVLAVLILFSLPAGLLLEKTVDTRRRSRRGNHPPPA